MKRRSMAVVGLLIAGLLVTLGPSGQAWAHEERSVGPYGIEVGFGDEPAYAGFPNSIQLIVTDARSDSPVTNLGDSVKVTVMTGQASMDLSLEPNFEIGGDGEPGDYRAWFIPTNPGTYTFQFTGKIGSTPFNQTFTSGPRTFDDVNDPTQAEFPVQAPTNEQLGQRVVSEAARLSAAVGAARSHADSAVRTPRLLAIVGILLAVLGLAFGILGLSVARKATRAGQVSRSPASDRA
jgi:hypothetical protein